MREYIDLTPENIAGEHLCCAIGDPKHQAGVDAKKDWLKERLRDGHVFRKLDAWGKTFIEYEPVETAWVPVTGRNYEYIYCLWVAGRFKGQGIGGELLTYAIDDARSTGRDGLCTLSSKKKKPFIGDKKFFQHYGFTPVDSIGDYELLALSLTDAAAPCFCDSARALKIAGRDFTVYYSPACPYAAYEVRELTAYAAEHGVKLDFIPVDTLEKAKSVPCVFNNWANFYRGEFLSTTILNANSFAKLLK